MKTHRPWALIAFLLCVLPTRSVAQEPEGTAITPANEGILNTMSGSLYYPIAHELGIEPKRMPAAPATESSFRLQDDVPDCTPPPCVRPYYLQMTNDTLSDNEPVVIGSSFGGNDFNITTYNHWSNGYKLNYSREKEGSSPPQIDIGQLPINSSYTSYGDPFLDRSSGGSSPNRVYNVGIMHNGGTAPAAIGLWRTDDAAATWLAPVVVASTGTNGVFLDKPSVAASAASNTLNYVYVIYSKIVTSPESFTILVAKSTNAGQTFGSSVQVATGAHLGGQQIVVDPTNGYVYALWVDYDSNQIKVSTSTNFNLTWSAPVIAATATYNFLGGLHPGTIPGQIRAITNPMFRYNTAAGRLFVVWHEADGPNATGTDIYVTNRLGGAWQPKLRVNNVTTNNQFVPSIAFDSSGLGLVAFYDRRDDPANIKFREYWQQVNSNGTLNGGNSQAPGPSPSAATYYLDHFIGDYQQTWWNTFPARPGFVVSRVGNWVIAQGAEPEVFFNYLPQY